jgi:hypothetical protein
VKSATGCYNIILFVSEQIFRYHLLKLSIELVDWTLTHTSYKDTEQSTIEAFITLDGITPTDTLIR